MTKKNSAPAKIKSRLEKRQACLPKGEHPNILHICPDIHERLSGAADPCPTTEELQYVSKFLQVCLDTWEPTIDPKLVKYDSAVHQMVQAVLDEIRWYGYKEEDDD
jgi:hypothetical protein